MLKLHLNLTNDSAGILRRSIVSYFQNPSYYIGFLDDKILPSLKTSKTSEVQVSLGGTLEEMFRCIVRKAQFHIDVNNSQVANGLIKRYLYINSEVL